MSRKRSIFEQMLDYEPLVKHMNSHFAEKEPQCDSLSACSEIRNIKQFNEDFKE